MLSPHWMHSSPRERLILTLLSAPRMGKYKLSHPETLLQFLGQPLIFGAADLRSEKQRMKGR